MSEQDPSLPAPVLQPWAIPVIPPVPAAPAVSAVGTPLTPAPEQEPAAPAETPAEQAPPAAPAAPAPVVQSPVVDAEQAAVAIATSDNVTVTAPKAFRLRIDNNVELEIAAGVQQMSRQNAEHWYSKANGVKIYQP